MCTRKSRQTTSASVHYVGPDYSCSCSWPLLLRKCGRFHGPRGQATRFTEILLQKWLTKAQRSGNIL